MSLVVHGRDHRGQLEGHPRNNVPVCNVSLPLLIRAFPHHLPFRVMDLPVENAVRLRGFVRAEHHMEEQCHGTKMPWCRDDT